MFGVCYYPEHWDRSLWKSDAAAMAELGIRYVRIGEFAWSRLEPRPGEYRFAWLDEAIDTLAAAGLKVVMCTPTATPPKWLVDRWPEILPVEPDTGQTRGFGSRRHYDFSNPTFMREALRISAVVAERYGKHAAVAGWQTDNELCCHDTAHSASSAARQAFQNWCASRYGTIDALNTAWGNVFWSMEYQDFSSIELPFAAVTETNPAHQLAYRRFASDAVVQFHQSMVDVIRTHAPTAVVTHNFIPMADTNVDNYALAAPLDFASYDNYPLGRTDQWFADADPEEFQRYMRTGYPDFAAYYFDQTRNLANRKFWVMEQQPGPVNWATNNPRPADGMIRLWTLEAFAHGAECVSYFRWRQVPFAQEQMHAGLLRPDNSRSEAWEEVEKAIIHVERLNLLEERSHRASVAIISSVESQWVSAIERQGDSYDYDRVQFDFYCALREIGIGVDFVSEDTDLSAYSVVVVPSLPIVSEAFVKRCVESKSTIVFGPRSGAKTTEFGIPLSLPPGPLQQFLPIRVLAVETLRSDVSEPLHWHGKTYKSRAWREKIDPMDANVLARYADDTAAAVQSGRFIYLATLTDRDFLRDFLGQLFQSVGVDTFELDASVRLQRRGNLTFAFNYSSETKTLPIPDDANILLGKKDIRAHDVTVWKDAATAE